MPANRVFIGSCAVEVDDAFVRGTRKLLRRERPRRGVRSSLRLPIEVNPIEGREHWVYVMEENHFRRHPEIVEIMQAHADYRGMQYPDQPLLYRRDADWFDWLLEPRNRVIIESETCYVLVVGGPQYVPFEFENFLDTIAAVGRLDFRDLARGLRSYLTKVRAFERLPRHSAHAATTNGRRLPQRSAVVLQHPPVSCNPEEQVTFNSIGKCFIAERAAEYFQRHGFQTERLFAGSADQEPVADLPALLRATRESEPGLILTVTHGYRPGSGLAAAERLEKMGALHLSPPDDLFDADDVRGFDAFAPGSVMWAYGCNTYGTPAPSRQIQTCIANPDREDDEDEPSWDEDNADGESEARVRHGFVARLPQALLALRNGPLAFIGHLDETLIFGIGDETIEGGDARERDAHWLLRLSPYYQVFDRLMAGVPIGRAMAPLSRRFVVTDHLLSGSLGENQESSEESRVHFAQLAAMRLEAKNNMLLGDPQVSLRMRGPADSQ